MAVEAEYGQKGSEHTSPKEKEWHRGDFTSLVLWKIVIFAKVIFDVHRRRADISVDHGQFFIFGGLR